MIVPESDEEAVAELLFLMTSPYAKIVSWRDGLLVDMKEEHRSQARAILALLDARRKS